MRKLLLALFFSFVFLVSPSPVHADTSITPSNPGFNDTITVSNPNFFEFTCGENHSGTEVTVPCDTQPRDHDVYIDFVITSPGAGNVRATYYAMAGVRQDNCLKDSTSGWETITCSNSNLSGRVKITSLLSSQPAQDKLFNITQTTYIWNGTRMAPQEPRVVGTFTVKGTNTSSYSINSITPNPAQIGYGDPTNITISLQGTTEGDYFYQIQEGLVSGHQLGGSAHCGNGSCEAILAISCADISCLFTLAGPTTTLKLQVREASTGVIRESTFNVEYISNDYCSQDNECNPGFKCLMDHAQDRKTCQVPTTPNIFLAKDSPCEGTIQDQCRRFSTALGWIGTNPEDFVKWILGFILSISGGIVLLIIIATGYRLMTSQGDPEKVKEARERLTAAIVGLLFIIFSLVILQAITVDIFHIPGFSK